MSKINTGFNYIDDDLQNLRQLLNFRVEDVLPKQAVSSPSKSQAELEVVTIETRPNKDVVLVDHRPVKGMSSCQGSATTSPSTSASPPSEPVVEAKPPFHYSDLIEFALREKEQLTVSEIYDWILQRFPYFKQVDENKWKPAVRHTLTTNSAFYKAKKASRGYLWAYRSPEQRRYDYDELQKRVGSAGIPNHWKKKKIAEYAEKPGYLMDNQSLLSSSHYYPVSVSVPVSGKMKAAKAFIIAPPKKALRPSTLVVESSESDSDLEHVNTYTCGMPCCNEQDSVPDGACSCLNVSCGIPKHVRYDASRENFDNWNPLGSSRAPADSSARFLWEEFQTSPSCLGKSAGSPDATDHFCMQKFDTMPLSSYAVKDSSQMMYVPCMISNNRNTALKSVNNTAPLYQVPKEVAIQESGLLAVPSTSTSLATLPNVGNLFPPRSGACTSLDEIFTLDDYTRCGMSSSFSSGAGLNTSSSSLAI